MAQSLSITRFCSFSDSMWFHTRGSHDENTGLWDRYIIYNLSQLILWLSNLFGGSYPLGIAVLR